MSYMALYRKWRPTLFEDVKGQEAIVQTLKNQIISDRIGHAYLFCGTRGTGKTSVAKIFSRAVNCEHPVNGSPCNECAVCRSILAGSSLNVVEIDAASNNGVDNIREIREQVEYPPTEGKYRVYIIDEVHMLSPGAFNALLKTLEEPPSYVIFILATTEVHKIPVTILSRCQRYDFKRIPVEVITENLRRLTQAEGIAAEEKALRFVAKSGDGAMRDALSLLEQCIAFHYGETLTYDFVLDVLGAVDTSVFSRLLRVLLQEKTKESIEILEEILLQGRELSQFITDFIWYLRNLMLVKNAENAEELLDVSAENLQALKEEAVMVSQETLMRYIRVLSELSNQIRYAAQKRVLIEVCLIKLTKPQMEQSLDSILERVAKLEEEFAKGIPTRAVASVQTAEAAIELPEGESRVLAKAANAGNAANPPQKVVLPSNQIEDWNFFRNEWGKITRDMGVSIRPSLRGTTLEPSGDSCLTIVFMDEANYRIGSRPSVLGDLERYVEENYQKQLTFKTRLGTPTEVSTTLYVTQEELEQNIHMDIQIEEES